MMALFEIIKNYIASHPYLSLFFTTFVSEDAAFFYALFSSQLSAVYLAGFYIAGVLVGDIGLYLTGYGSRILRYKLKSNVDSTEGLKKVKHVESMDVWLMMTRFLPGTRLITYTYLGYTRYSFLRFVSLLTLSTFFQIFIGFTFVSFFSKQFDLQLWSNKFWMAVCSMISSIFVFKIIMFVLKWKKLSLDALKVKFISYYRLIYKEFWPSLWIYLFMTPVFIYLAIKYRNISYWLYCNPGIKNSGVVGESKDELDKVLQTMPKKFLLKQSKAFNKKTYSFTELMNYCDEHSISFPLFAKPVMGHKGLSVAKINKAEDLKSYYDKANFDFIVQEASTRQEEMGLFFMKKLSGYALFSVTYKRFPYVSGNGKDTLKKLIYRDSYLSLFAPAYFKAHQEQWNTIIEQDKKFPLTSAGNHSQGCIFKNGHFLKTKALEKTLNEMLEKFEGIHIGRLDVKFDFKDGEVDVESLQVIELNGAGAEPTHIYDQKTSLFDMYSSLYKQYDYMFKVGKNNYHQKTAWSLGSFLKDTWKTLRKVNQY